MDRSGAVSALLVSLLLVAAVFSLSASATTYTVLPDGTGDFPTIQAAVDSCSNGDIIELGNGVFTGDGNCNIDYLGKAITVRSISGDPEACTVNCGGNRGFLFRSGEGADSVLEGVGIANGFSERGGGVYCTGSSPTLTRITLHSCAAWADSAFGGGLYCRDASPTLTDVAFLDNEVLGSNGCALGGGMYSSGGSPSLTNVVFEGNWVGGSFATCRGGGMYCDGGSPVFAGAVFSGNSALLPWNWYGEAGGLCCVDASTVLTEVLFSGNEADEAGGMQCVGGSATLTRVTFSDNRGAVASGIAGQSASVSLTNCIVAFGSWGAGVACSGAVLTCCDVYGNVGGDWVGCSAGQLGTNGNISADPLFCGRESGDFTIAAASPCAPEHNPECGLIGVGEVACDAISVVEETSWGSVKAMFR